MPTLIFSLNYIAYIWSSWQSLDLTPYLILPKLGISSQGKYCLVIPGPWKSYLTWVFTILCLSPNWTLNIYILDDSSYLFQKKSFSLQTTVVKSDGYLQHLKCFYLYPLSNRFLQPLECIWFAETQLIPFWLSIAMASFITWANLRICQSLNSNTNSFKNEILHKFMGKILNSN